MMDNNAIADLQEQATSRAAARHRQPHVLYDESTAFDDVRHATNLGTYIPPGWKPARYEDYCEGLTRSAEVSQDACGSEFKGELVWWVDKGWGPERGEYGVEEIREDARKLVVKAAERGVALGASICEEGQFQLYIRFLEKPYRKRSKSSKK